MREKLCRCADSHEDGGSQSMAAKLATVDEHILAHARGSTDIRDTAVAVELQHTIPQSLVLALEDTLIGRYRRLRGSR